MTLAELQSAVECAETTCTEQRTLAGVTSYVVLFVSTANFLVVNLRRGPFNIFFSGNTKVSYMSFTVCNAIIIRPFVRGKDEISEESTKLGFANYDENI